MRLGRLWYTNLACGLPQAPMPFNREVTLFPASGYRNNNDGSLNNVGNNGYYWSAVPNNTNNGCNLNFNQWNVNPQNNNNRSYGFSVRPVSEFTARSGESFSIQNS
ncbi:MAG: hypothetical protein SOW45_01655 [Prevotella sp.]|nr:hypothetical protein [Prevotella sp.]